MDARQEADPQFCVYYDGACPLCRREIAFYRARDGADRVAWIDVSAAAQPAPDLAQSQALARFHVRTQSGELLSGGAAFAGLWQALPGFRLAGRVFALRPLAWLLEFAYTHFLKLRPHLQRWAATAETPTPTAVWLERELRSDHAGESGAVAIYAGILFATRDPAVRAFAAAHQATEAEHLALIETVLPAARRSRLVGLWRVAGFATGFLPALAGPRAVYATIASVETFVDAHYQAQIDRLTAEGIEPELTALLERCRQDEVHHRDEAQAAFAGPPGALLGLWCRLVGAGSAHAVKIARRI